MFLGRFCYCTALFLFALSSRVIFTEGAIAAPPLSEVQSGSMLDSFIGNYMGINQLGSYLISLLFAIVLAVIIAFHPQTYGRKESISDIEAPKTLIFYAMIGSLVGATVADYGPQLGFIFFGLGGLMRFRTNSGTSIQTGRLILVALIGLCCGLKMLYIAAISTVVVWVLIYILERKTIHHIEIKKIARNTFSESVTAYSRALQKLKCKIIIEKKNSTKSKVNIIFSAPSKLNREGIENFLEEHVTEDNRGAINWNT